MFLGVLFNMDKNEIIREIEKHGELIGNEKIVAVYLFGSVANGKANALSDIDVCVVDNGIEWKEKLKIMGMFGDKYDVSFFSDMPAWIKMRVLKGVPIIVNNKNLLYDISFGALKEYEDFKPLLRERMLRRFGRCTI